MDVNTNEADRRNPITYEHKTYKVYSLLTEIKVLPRCVVNPSNCQGFCTEFILGDVGEPPGAKMEMLERS